jgi:hypothetical protein
MGRFVYLPFFVVTLIQMIGNIFFSFTYIDETSQLFQDWVAMTGGIFEMMGIERTDLNSHKTIVSFLSGGLLPIISLTFAHMLVKFSEQSPEDKKVLTEDEFKEILKERRENSENEKWTPTQEQLEILEKVLVEKYKGPENEKIIEKPINPTKEELDELEKLMDKIVKDKNKVVEDYHIEEPKDITVNDTTDEVEKKNDTHTEISEETTGRDENYKVLNYSNRNA